MQIVQTLSTFAIPGIILIIVIYGIKEKKKVYDLFMAGAKDGVKIVISIFPTLLGLFMAVSGVAGIFGRLMYGKIYDSKGILLVIVMCMAGNALAALIMANATAYKHIIAAAFIIGLFTTGSSAALQADAVKCLGKERAGVATSSRSIGNDIGYMLGSMVVAGFVEKYGTYKTSYMCMFFLSIISIVLFVVYYKRKA